MAGLSTGTTATTTQANELCIGCIAFDISINTFGPTNSFTEVTERASGAPNLTVLERIVSATGTYGTTVDWGDGSNHSFIPNTYALCGAIATFKSNEIDASISISSSAATATLLTITEKHESFISINVANASSIMPNINVQASAQTSAPLSTASATLSNPTFNIGVSRNISASTAMATLLTVAENHGSSYPLSNSAAQAGMFGVTPLVAFTPSVFTATANTLALTANGTASVSLNVMTALAKSKDATAQESKGAVARRIIISCG